MLNATINAIHLLSIEPWFRSVLPICWNSKKPKTKKPKTFHSWALCLSVAIMFKFDVQESVLWYSVCIECKRMERGSTLLRIIAVVFGIWCQCSSKCSTLKCVQINRKFQDRKRYQYHTIEMRAKIVLHSCTHTRKLMLHIFMSSISRQSIL